MAIYHLSVKPVQRSQGRSATAAAAYRSGEKLKDERTGDIHDYTSKRGVEHSDILTPNGESINRERLWNMAEWAEKRKDGTPAREYEVAIPEELNPEQRRALVVDFGRALARRHGCAVDLAIHAPGRDGDYRNHHAHILCTTRRYEPGGKLGEKCDVELSDRDRAKKGLTGRKAELEKTREQWDFLANRALARAGRKSRISHKSLEAQGVGREPSIHLGPVATAIERRGERSERGDINLALKGRRAERDELAALEGQQSGISAARTRVRQWRQEQAMAAAAAQRRTELERENQRQREEQEQARRRREAAKKLEAEQEARKKQRQNEPQKSRKQGMSR